MPDTTVRTQYNLLLEITEVVLVAETSRGLGISLLHTHTQKYHLEHQAGGNPGTEVW